MGHRVVGGGSVVVVVDVFVFVSVCAVRSKRAVVRTVERKIPSTIRSESDGLSESVHFRGGNSNP